MSNPNKRKGTKWEVDVKGFANNVLGHRTRVYRPAQEGFRDVGDLHGLSPFIGQAKNWTSLAAALREGVKGAVQQAQNAGERYGVAFIKAPRKPTGESYAVLRIVDFLDFYREYLDLREENRSLRNRLGIE